MPDIAGLARQLAAPTGLGGMIVGRMMDVANSKPLSHSIAALVPQTGEHILDLGAGTGAGTIRLLRAGARVTAVDHSHLMVEMMQRRFRDAIGQERVAVHQGDFAALPLVTGDVDAILAVNVLYFWHNPVRIAAEIRRVLRPGGRFVAYVTDASTMSRWGMATVGTHRLYDAAALIDVVKMIAPDASWQIEMLTTFGARGMVVSSGHP